VKRKLENALAVLNGLVGDHLARTDNGLVTPMAFMHDGRPIPMTRAALQAAYGTLSARAVILVHGLMNTETIWELPGGSDYGRHLERDLGFTPFYLRYNSGLPIVDNGAAFARLLDALVKVYPVPIEEILLIGYSMGGLVVRSACHEAMGLPNDAPSAFLPLVRRAIYVGTPHLGAPYERLGRVVSSVLHAINDPYTRLIGDIADLRSAGLQDLGDADLRHEDRERRSVGLRLSDWQHPVPLLPQVKHHLVAGSLSEIPWLRAFFGDAVVPVPSALAGGVAAAPGAPNGSFPVRVLAGLTHLDLAHHPEVYAQIRAWSEPTE
jgi:triacylglycerol lipase